MSSWERSGQSQRQQLWQHERIPGAAPPPQGEIPATGKPYGWGVIPPVKACTVYRYAGSATGQAVAH
ncbi:MAG: hypothetical protein ACFB9N_09355 [Geitlerinemataceae cyanobacterium]